MSPIPGIDAMDIGMWKELRDTESGGDLNHASVDLPTAQRLGQASPRGRSVRADHGGAKPLRLAHRPTTKARAAVISDTVHCTQLGCDCPGNQWWTGWIGPAEIHLVPIDDLRPHHSEVCPCDPSIELHVVGDG